MQKSKFTNGQIAFVLKQADEGTALAEAYRASHNLRPFPNELPPDLAEAVDPQVLFESMPDVGAQGLIAASEIRQACRISPLRPMIAACGKSDRQQCADLLDPVRITMRLNEIYQHFDRRSTSAIAKIHACLAQDLSFACATSRGSDLLSQ